MFVIWCCCLFQTIKDSQLTGLVCAMSSVVVVILIIWEFVGPQVIIIKEIKKEVLLNPFTAV